MKTSKHIFKVLCSCLVAGWLCFTAFVETAMILAQVDPIQAQIMWPQLVSTPIPFLYAPYYGKTDINSVFDHQYPIYDAEPIDVRVSVMHHDGSIKNWSYSGHSGIDYDVNFQRVLAVADGTVIYAGWNSPINHRYNYGLYARVRHGEGEASYQSYYGHLSSLAVRTGDNRLYSK